MNLANTIFEASISWKMNILCTAGLQDFDTLLQAALTLKAVFGAVLPPSDVTFCQAGRQ